jgi:hypothetical protein
VKKLVVAHHFYLTPFVADAFAPHEFFVLGLSGVHVGTLSDREAFPEYLHYFFEIVDRGLKLILNDNSLLLMGVQEQLAAYRRVAKYPHIFTTDCLGTPFKDRSEKLTHELYGNSRMSSATPA